ncbi:MAG: energy-coupling factor transporter ATPase [Chloroflexi bacterium]|nr:energy-coupling factor transporter ATPase [Chloroflexota bacterium]
MAEPFIKVENLFYSYEVPSMEPIPALVDISLRIMPGEFLAIVGHNGSGKSTLAKCISGLLTPTQGQVSVLGLNTRQPANQRQIRAAVGLVLQNPDNQFVAAVVEEEVAFGAENLGIPQDSLRRRVDQALLDTGLQQERYANPHNLSAGLKSRLAIAGILAIAPQCLILDESTALLDPLSRASLLLMLHELHRSGLAIVTITHYMDEVIDTDRVIVLDAGKLVIEGSPRQVFQQEARLREIGLDLPPVGQIARGLRTRGLDIGYPLTVEELIQAHQEHKYD